jgi:hypothetical protein
MSVLVVALATLMSAPLVAQMGGMMGMMPPSLSGVWNPVVGSGATYEMVDKNGQKQTFTFEIVGKEDVNGQPGYWMEIVGSDKTGQQFVVQTLMFKNGSQVTTSKTIIQAGGRGPMEFSANSPMMSMGNRGGAPAAPPKADFRESAERVGSESVTTLGGTIETEHWRNKDGSGDVWFSEKLAPWGLVKATGQGSSITLVKVITDAKSHIVGTPMNMDDMMNGRGRGRGQ